MYSNSKYQLFLFGKQVYEYDCRSIKCIYHGYMESYTYDDCIISAILTYGEGVLILTEMDEETQ